jgi:hypothetical protein
MNLPDRTRALLAELYRLGVRLKAEGEQIRCVARPGVVTSELRAEVAACKELLLCILDPCPPQPPPGARLHFQDEGGRNVDAKPNLAAFWCWEGGPAWYRVSEFAPPVSLGRADTGSPNQ